MAAGFLAVTVMASRYGQGIGGRYGGRGCWMLMRLVRSDHDQFSYSLTLRTGKTSFPVVGVMVVAGAVGLSSWREEVVNGWLAWVVLSSCREVFMPCFCC